MPLPSLALEGVTQVLADGRILFSDLDERFDQRPTALVGRNGVGKSVLAAILAGRIAPTAGRCVRDGRVHYLPQQVVPSPTASIGELAGLGAPLAALARIESGGCDPEDFERVGERWNLRHELQEALRAEGLAGFVPETPATRLSGGEAMRVALAGAWLSDADFLVLDEPGNHLDRDARARLRTRLRAWPRGLLLVSHDRTLLGEVERIVELSVDGLASHGGGYEAYLDSRRRQADAAQRQLAHARAERARQRQEAIVLHEREQRRQSRDRQQRRDANQAAILLDRQRGRSEQSAGRRALLRQQAATQMQQQVREAASRVDDAAPVAMFAPVPATATRRCVARLDAVALPLPPGDRPRLSFAIGGTQRIGVVGANGCGKSTLLRLLAGAIAPASGRCEVHVPVALLDQTLSLLSPAASALDNLRAAAPRMSEAGRRMRLAQLGLDAARIVVPAGVLSGGERLKAALACVLHTAEPPPVAAAGRAGQPPGPGLERGAGADAA